MLYKANTNVNVNYHQNLNVNLNLNQNSNIFNDKNMPNYLFPRSSYKINY